MRCPVCARSELEHVDLGEHDFVGVERCPHCHGCWLAVSELERIEDGVWSSLGTLGLTSAEALSDSICPRCSARMAAVNPEDHPELAIERCPTCHGLWLDAGELARLHDVAVEHVAEHGDLHRRPDGWSLARWVAYRLAAQWRHLH